MANILELIHKGTGNKGRFLKEYQPTGKPKTTQIQLLNGQIFFAPSIEFELSVNTESANIGPDELTHAVKKMQDSFKEVVKTMTVFSELLLKIKKDCDSVK